MKKTIGLVGIIFIVLGILLGIIEINNAFLSKSSVGVISNIFERKRGAEYSGVEIGSVNPCQLEITYIDDSGNKQIGTTSNEKAPCSSFFNNYYKIGDQVNIVYREDGLNSVKLNGLLDKFGFLIIFPIFGLGLVYFSKKVK